ncbi:MAG: hypothetical protein HY364_01420 [Candidatus Aenigmarchaeota archaeon]|nr:hypothetical protein [Candidatus Aenigmarchaeota archaeon]
MLKVFLALLIFSPAFAHLDAGQDVAVGGYLADFGHSPGNISSGESGILAFNLANVTTGDALIPQNVWVRISKGDDVTFAGSFAPHGGSVTFTYLFPEAGVYTIKARYFGNESILAEADFAVRIEERASDNTFTTAFLFLLGLFVVILYTGRY